MSRNPTISLTQQQQEFVSELVGSGRYHGVTEVMRAGLRLLQEREDERRAVIKKLEDIVDEGVASGDPEPMPSVDEFLAQAHKRYQEKNKE